jgi:hypothetical protein
MAIKVIAGAVPALKDRGDFKHGDTIPADFPFKDGEQAELIARKFLEDTDAQEPEQKEDVPLTDNSIPPADPVADNAKSEGAPDTPPPATDQKGGSAKKKADKINTSE